MRGWRGRGNKEGLSVKIREHLIFTLMYVAKKSAKFAYIIKRLPLNYCSTFQIIKYRIHPQPPTGMDGYIMEMSY